MCERAGEINYHGRGMVVLRSVAGVGRKEKKVVFNAYAL